MIFLEKQMIKLKDLIVEAVEKKLYDVYEDGPYTAIERKEKDGDYTWREAKKYALDYVTDHYKNYQHAVRDMRALKKKDIDDEWEKYRK